jgi:hypothetical protein
LVIEIAVKPERPFAPQDSVFYPNKNRDIAEMLQNWLIDSPILSWGFAHPLGGLVAVVVLIMVLGGLVRAIAQLTEQLWVRLLQLPMRAGQWLLTQLLHLLKLKPPTANRSQTIIANHPEPDPQICEIMMRLEHLQQEQTLLLQDIKTLLVKEEKSLGRKK